eukprot:CAMPEP_0197620258 /NCGR_PEP_ID=MMETSP1338-20131121/1119_1 /TAXON_ID=43686 ORGANISM="Pelagodinium beii, Strain RCC1491" /NCGR_SAMPLE_ID=MMETSP1338 /ASSEMBLY_ACC=CAM_ASM_000754 /LENGTH=103 /DNA_ID=CAMNT_0043189393 /DNA_START=83 /DNA_END=394 /DNA_ORIENTATION=-
MAKRTSKLLAVLLLGLAAFFVTQTFVGPASKISHARAETSEVTVSAQEPDPLDFVGITGKKIEANGQREQVMDLDNFFAVFYTVLSLAFMYAAFTFLQSLRPS